MARFTSLFVTLLVTLYALVSAAPLGPRALGNLACNIARLQIVGALQGTVGDVKKISTTAGLDTATADSVTAAQAGLKSAQGGIKQIAAALLTNQPPPDSGRDVVAEGLASAKTALDSINSTSAAVTQKVSTAKDGLDRTIAAGQRVVANCGGGAPADVSSASVSVAAAATSAAAAVATTA